MQAFLPSRIDASTFFRFVWSERRSLMDVLEVGWTDAIIGDITLTCACASYSKLVPAFILSKVHLPIFCEVRSAQLCASSPVFRSVNLPLLASEDPICSYALMFEPRGSGAGPSGLHDWPRAFVLRAGHLDGKTMIWRGVLFISICMFSIYRHCACELNHAFAQLGAEGLGLGRKKVELIRVESLCEDASVGQVLYSEGRIHPRIEPAVISFPLKASATGETRLAVRFATPTELKSESRIVSRPEFAVLAGRIRDRVSTLCELYGHGAPLINYKALGERALAVRMTRCEIHTVQVRKAEQPYRADSFDWRVCR